VPAGALPVIRAVVDVDVFTFLFYFILVAFFFVSVLLPMLFTTIVSMSVSVNSFISRVVDLFIPTDMLLLKKAFLEETALTALTEVTQRSDHQSTHDSSVTIFYRSNTDKKPVLDVLGCASYAAKAAGYAAKRETRSKQADRTLGFKASESEPDRGRVALFQATLCSILDRDYSAQELAALSTLLKSVEHSFVFKHCALTNLARVEYKKDGETDDEHTPSDGDDGDGIFCDDHLSDETNDSDDEHAPPEFELLTYVI
jgi:hypothetical protein